MHRIQQRLSGENGQAAVLIAILCGVLIVIVAMTTNLGKVVTEKMAMQNAVDMAAYSGAASQAGHLNRMRQINQLAWQTAYDTRLAMEASQVPGVPIFHSLPSYDNCSCPTAIMNPNGLQAPLADTIINTADITMQGFKTAIKAENTIGWQAGEQAAREAADRNYKGAQVTPIHRPSGGGMMKISDTQIEVSYFGWCMFICPPSPPIPMRAIFSYNYPNGIHSWQYKDDDGIVMYAASINEAPKSPFMDLTNYFTPQSCQFGELRGGRCSLQVYSVAEVYHGKLGSILNGKGSRNVERPSVWDESHGMQSVQIDSESLLDDHRVENGEYQDYQVRFIGIFENQALLIGDNQSVSDKIQYGSLMEH